MTHPLPPAALVLTALGLGLAVCLWRPVAAQTEPSALVLARWEDEGGTPEAPWDGGMSRSENAAGRGFAWLRRTGTEVILPQGRAMIRRHPLTALALGREMAGRGRGA